MKKSYSTHFNPLHSSYMQIHHKKHTSINSKFKSVQSPHTVNEPFSKTNYYKSSFFNFTNTNEKKSKTLRNTNTSSLSKTMIYERERGNRTQRIKSPLLDDPNIDLDLEMFQSPTAIRNSFNNRSPHIYKGSKAYSDAMKALQNKVKKLEEKNSQLEKNFREFEGNIKQIVENTVAEKTSIFIALETNLKDKINNLEEENVGLKRLCQTLNDDLENLGKKLRLLEQKSNLDFKEFLQEKNDLKKIIINSKDKMHVLEDENQHLNKIKNDILKEKKNMNNSIDNYQNTFHLLKKQNENLKLQSNSNFNHDKNDQTEKSKNVENLETTQIMRTKLEDREREIDFLKEKFQAFLAKNEVKILSKDTKTYSSHSNNKNNENKTKIPGSLRKQKTKDNCIYENKALDNMISNIISVNSCAKIYEKEENNLNSKKIANIRENVFFSTSLESIKKVKKDLNDSNNFSVFNTVKSPQKNIWEIKILEKDLEDLIYKHKEMSNQILVSFFFYLFCENN